MGRCWTPKQLPNILGLIQGTKCLHCYDKLWLIEGKVKQPYKKSYTMCLYVILQLLEVWKDLKTTTHDQNLNIVNQPSSNGLEWLFHAHPPPNISAIHAKTYHHVIDWFLPSSKSITPWEVHTCLVVTPF